MYVQYRGEYQYRRGVQYRGGYLEYRGGVQYCGEISWVPWGLSWVPWGMFSTVGDIMMHVGGYHEYRGGCSVPWGKKSFVIWAPHGTEHSPRHSWYPPTVLKFQRMVPFGRSSVSHLPLEYLSFQGSDIDMLRDRDQRSYFWKTQTYFPTDWQRTQKIFSENQNHTNTLLRHDSFSKRKVQYDGNEKLCLLKYLVNKTGPKKYCWNYETLKNTAFLWKKDRNTAAAMTDTKKLQYFRNFNHNWW